MTKQPKDRVRPELVIGHAAFHPFPQPKMAPEDIEELLKQTPKLKHKNRIARRRGIR